VIYSRRCEYAIRALVYLARRSLEEEVGDELVRLSVISEAQDLPLPYARKICRDMVQIGLLRSARGPRGGYALARPPSEISLLQIRDAVDGTSDLEGCAVGLNPCTDETPCSLHDTWKPLRKRLKRYLEETTLGDVARGRALKRHRLRRADDGQGGGAASESLAEAGR